MPPVDHDCSLRDIVVAMSNKIAKLEHELGQLKKAHIGPKSERSKMPRVPTKPPTPEERLAKRRAQAADRAQTETVRTEHKVPVEERTCPSCGNDKLKPIGEGRTTTVFEFVPARFVRHEHVQEVLRCRCGDYVVTAPGAPKAIEKGRYGASLLAHLAVVHSMGQRNTTSAPWAKDMVNAGTKAWTQWRATIRTVAAVAGRPDIARNRRGARKASRERVGVGPRQWRILPAEPETPCWFAHRRGARGNLAGHRR